MAGGGSSSVVGGGTGGVGGANSKRSGVSTGGRSSALLRSSMVDEEETSRLSEGSLTSLEKEAVSEFSPPRGSSIAGLSGGRSRNQEYSRHRQETG